jgi:acetyl esterase/lipase
VAYDDRFGRSTIMDVFLPVDGKTDRPAVLMIHGGGWKSFSKSAYSQEGPRLAGAGYVVASINYRLTPAGVYPNLMQDSHCALAFFRSKAAEYGLDPDRVAVLGYSAGGHMASLLGVAWDEPDFQPDCAAGSTFAPAAVISGAGPQDLFDLAWADAVQDLIGGSDDDYPERYRKASPIERARPDAPPFLFIHGSQDLIVPFDHSVRMQEQLEIQGVEARLLELAAGGHVFNNGADPGQLDVVGSASTPEAWAATIDFLDRTIGPDRGAP